MDIKKLRQIGFILLTVIIAVAVAFILIPKNEKKKVVKVDKQATRNQAAKRSLGWIDQQKDTDGFYFMDARCKGTDCNELSKDSKSWRETPYIIWGRYKYFVKTNDTTQLAKIDADFEAMFKKSLQMGSWNCKLMQDLVLDKNLPEKERKLAIDLCYIGGYEGKEEETTTNDITISKLMISISENKPITIKGYKGDNLKNNFDRNAFVASEYMTVHNLNLYPTLTFSNGNKISVEDASRNNFLKALYGYNLLTKEERTVSRNSVLGIAALDLYGFTNIHYYLDFAIYLESQCKINAESMNLNDLAYHAYFVKEMSNYARHDESVKSFENNIDKIINNKFDGIGLGGNKWNKGAFFEPKGNYYSAQLNGLTTGIILSL